MEEFVTESLALLTESGADGKGASSLLESYLADLVPDLIGFALSVAGAVLVYVIGGRIIRWLRRVFRKMMARHNVDEGVQQFLDGLAKYMGYFVLILMILGFFGVTAASVVAVLGSAGLTLGLALQEAFPTLRAACSFCCCSRLAWETILSRQAAVWRATCRRFPSFTRRF